MHKLAEKMADCLKAKVEGMGIDNIEGAALEELGKWVDIIKDIACYDKDMRIIKAMDEAEENEEKMKYIEEYEDYPEMEERRYYRGQPRDSRGRYMSRRGRRMGYDEPWDEMYDEMEYYRDMDRNSPNGMNRMYYTEPITTGSKHDSTGSMDNVNHGTSRYENARRGYEEKKTMGADKAEKMKGLEEYMKELSTDVSSMLTDMTPEEKTLMKQKMSVLMSKIQ